MHRLVSIGNRYYQYDSNGNVTAEQDGSFDEETAVYGRAVDVDGNGVKSTDYGWGLFKDSKSASESEQYKRVYTWDEKNRLIASSDSTYTVSYLYSQDGERTNKYTLTSETLYFSKMWSCHTDAGNATEGGQTSKHIYLGDTRIVTKLNSGTNPTYSEEYNRQYYYHADHLGSAHLITDKDGNEYQRLEYTPYGEIWVEKTSNTGLEYLPYKFTGKEMDSETGLYYYGARYLDPKYSRWLSTDPALGDYIPQAPISDEAKKHNQNLPGMGGIFNTVNLSLYHYAGNNPVKYTDPDGMMDEKLETPSKINDTVSAIVSTGETVFKEAGKPQFTGTTSQAFNDLGIVEGVQYCTPKKIIDPKIDSAASAAKGLGKLGRALTVIGIGIAATDVGITAYKTQDLTAVGKRVVRNAVVIAGSMVTSSVVSAATSPFLSPVGGTIAGIVAGTVVGATIDSKFEKVGW